MNAQLVTRSGRPFEGSVSFDEKGRPFYLEPRKCGRCGGAGSSDRWIRTGKVCFDCGGSGRHVNGPARVRLFTADDVSRLDAAQTKRNATKAAKHAAKLSKEQAEAEARRVAFQAEHGALIARCKAYLAERYGEADLEFKAADDFVFDVLKRAERFQNMSEGQAAALTRAVDRFDAEQARKAKAGFVGEVGERLSLTLTIVRVSDFDRPCFGAPWKTETVWITSAHDVDGNCFVVKGRPIGTKGEVVTLKGTVKEHSTFRDEKQTVLQRVKVG